ncbi:MAG: DUF4126 domain-containing protein [Nitrospira sp.]|nr:DUF4126 domain-containing protein [Nitrospira sp.]
MDFGSTFLAILTGLGLSAACGFQVFIPPLVVGIAAQTGNLELTEGLAWLGEWPALITLSIAAVLDSIAHKVSVIDRMLVSVEAPLVAVAGTILSASMVTDMDPLLQWGLAAIAGGGSSEAIHLSKSSIKSPFSMASDDTPSIAEVIAEEVGFGELKLFASIAEDVTATALPISAICFPVFTAFIVVFILVLLVVTAFMIKKYIVKLKKWIFNRRQQPA